MPELPEVETTVRGLRPHTENRLITKACFHRKSIRYPLEKQWITNITAQQIITVSRRAKIIKMQLTSGWLLWHLGMTGSLRVSRQDEAKRRHDHVEIYLDNQRILRFHDPRRFGYLQWFADEDSLLQSISHYGVEPLSTDFNAAQLWASTRGKKQPIKNYIMNQQVVVGVGNIYACEALFYAGIRPQTPCGKISRKNYEKLVTEIKNVLHTAIKQGGTTISDFENAEAKPGYFQHSLAVYGRDGEDCQSCQAAIEAIKLAGRNSFYCPSCQK